MHILGVIALSAAVDAPSADGSRSEWVAQVLFAFARSHVTGFVFEIGRWMLLGVLVGAIAAVAACVLFSHLGWYDIRGRFSGVLRWTIYVVTTILAIVLVGLAGIWQGAVRGSELVLTKSQLATDVFPLIADAVADGMAWVQVHAAAPAGTNSPDQAARLDDFRAGKWELQVAEFQKQLEALQEATVTDAVDGIVNSALEHAPQLRGGLNEMLLRQFLSGLGRRVLQGNVPGLPQSWGAGRVYSAARQHLKTEAAKAGNPETIARKDISAFVVREGIVPGLLNPIRVIARTQQVLLVAVAALVLIVPPACIRVARGWLGSSSRDSSMSPPVA